MNLCFIYQKRLAWAEDSATPPPAWLQRHLRTCPACRQFAAGQREVANALRSSASRTLVEAPPFLSARIRSALRNETRDAASDNFGWRWNFGALVPIVGLLLAVGFLLNRSMRPARSPAGMDTASFPLTDWNPQTASTQLVAWAEQVHEPLEAELDSVLSDAKNAFTSLAGNFLPDQAATAEASK